MRMPCLSRPIRLAGHVGVDGLLAPQVVGLAVVDGPLRGLVEVGDVEVLVEQLAGSAPSRTRRPTRSGRWPSRAGAGRASSMRLDHVAVAEEVDLLDARRAVGDAGAGEQGVDRPAAARRRRRRSRPCRTGRAGWRVTPSRVTSARSITTTSAPASSRTLGGGRTHAGGAADDEGALALVAECVEQCHVDWSPGWVVWAWCRSGDDAADLEVDDRCPSRGRGSRGSRRRAR